MKHSLLKDIISYAKTKGRAPLDERQMNTLKDLYIELAKSTLLGCMVFIILYGYMDFRNMECQISFLSLSSSYLGALTYYYLIRFCYQQVIGIDANFEILVVPALFFTPNLILNTIHIIGDFLQLNSFFYIITALLWPVYLLLIYLGANRIYQKGQIMQEQQLENGEIRFRSRKQVVNYIIITIIILALFPISYDLLFQLGLLASTVFILYLLWYYGFHTPQNEYILDESGLHYYKALWNRQGGHIAYQDIESVEQRDTFNIGYAKDKVLIHCKDGQKIMLFPENAYQFCIEIENNLY